MFSLKAKWANILHVIQAGSIKYPELQFGFAETVFHIENITKGLLQQMRVFYEGDPRVIWFWLLMTSTTVLNSYILFFLLFLCLSVIIFLDCISWLWLPPLLFKDFKKYPWPYTLISSFVIFIFFFRVPWLSKTSQMLLLNFVCT